MILCTRHLSSVLILGLQFCAMLWGQQRTAEEACLLLWYTAPAEKWEEALPVGNGRLGAMVFGRAAQERIQINEDTVWSGGPYEQVIEFPTSPGTSYGFDGALKRR